MPSNTLRTCKQMPAHLLEMTMKSTNGPALPAFQPTNLFIPQDWIEVGPF
jgi:hypothetical protein